MKDREFAELGPRPAGIVTSAIDSPSDAGSPSNADAARTHGPVTLRFRDAEFERAFLQGEYDRNRPWILGSLVLALTFVLLFYPLDRLFIPAAVLDRVQGIRLYVLAATPILGIAGLLAIRQAPVAIPFVFTFIVIAGLAWTAIRSLTGPSAEPYIAFGVAQTILFTYVCLGLPFRWSAPAVTLILAPIIVLAAAQGLDSTDFWYTSASLITLTLIASYGAFRHEWSLRERFVAEHRFKAEYAQRLAMEHERSEWLGVIAGFTRHELKNAMAGIGSSLELLDRLGLPESGTEYLSRAMRSLQFMRTVLQQVANATSLDSALELQEVENVDLSRLVAGRGDDLRRDTSGLRCEFLVAEGVHVRGNADSLLQMLDKLINNAMEHLDSDRMLRVTLEALDGRALLTVLNHGDPLPPDADSLFRPFFSAGPSTQEGNLGLGLYVAQTIARRHGGTIRAEPTADHPGARFTVDLPLLAN